MCLLDHIVITSLVRDNIDRDNLLHGIGVSMSEGCAVETIIFP